MAPPNILQKRMVSYLDGKAERIKQTDSMDPSPYATSTEMSQQLNANLVSICKAAKALLAKGCVRMYPKRNDNCKNRMYGSLSLPEVSYDELLRKATQSWKMS